MNLCLQVSSGKVSAVISIDLHGAAVSTRQHTGAATNAHSWDMRHCVGGGGAGMFNSWKFSAYNNYVHPAELAMLLSQFHLSYQL